MMSMMVDVRNLEVHIGSQYIHIEGIWQVQIGICSWLSRIDVRQGFKAPSPRSSLRKLKTLRSLRLNFADMQRKKALNGYSEQCISGDIIQRIVYATL